jgi:ComF family protein
LYRSAHPGLNPPAPLAVAIQRLKYARRRALADALGILLAERYPFAPTALLVPVPLHITRLRERGFNQAVLLARRLAAAHGLPVASRALVRTRPTHAQPGLAAAARRTNLAGAFALRPGAVVAGRQVVLVDDVLTTGATADACAAVLAAAGAARVDVYTVGRAPRP